MSDLFQKYLSKRDESPLVQRALTDSSYVTKINCKKKGLPIVVECNSDLATIGDAIIKFCLLEILLSNNEEDIKLSKRKAKYESDRALVEVIARHYELLEGNYIFINDDDDKIPVDYEYIKEEKEYEATHVDKNGKVKRQPHSRNKHKYIATAVEALIAAIYFSENKDTRIGKIEELLRTWMQWIDDIGIDNDTT